MFDPTCFVLNTRWGYVLRTERCDYHRGVPWREKLNPLRYTVGIGRHRPCRIVLNKNAHLNRKFGGLLWRGA